MLGCKCISTPALEVIESAVNSEIHWPCLRESSKLVFETETLTYPFLFCHLNNLG